MEKKNPNVYQRALNIVNSRINPDISQGGVQPDWNQNDSTAADYVKNRPFYTGELVETVFVEESTVSFENKGGFYVGSLSQELSFIVGESYTVYWDSTAYECVCAELNGMPLLGNLAIAGAGSDTGEPFLIAIESGIGTMIYTTDTSSSHAISIKGLATEIVKIDEKYLPFLSKPAGKSYLTFSSRNSFRLDASEKTWNGTLEYFASDETWTVWDGTSSLTSVYNGGGYVIYLRGTGNTVITGNRSSVFSVNASDIACIGNIENLLDYATVESGKHPVMADYCFFQMFFGCTSLTQAPELPSTTLAKSCYDGMFLGCTSLTQAPELPATTLAEGCYRGMFAACTSLTQAPELPATTLAEGCYKEMFSGCTSLKQAPELPATTLAASCYETMFSDCTSLAQIPELPATTLANSCYMGMFVGCTSLAQIPELPATTLANDYYYNMFVACTSLKLSTTKTEEYTQEYRIPFSGDGTTSGYPLSNMFRETGGTFTGTPEINTTYYLSSDNMIARGTEAATLNGYVKNMIDNAECIIPSSTSGSTKKFKITVDDSGAITATEVT